MFDKKFCNRYSYNLTKDFWQCIEEEASKYAANSVDAAIIRRDSVIFQIGYSYGLRIEEMLNLTINDLNFDSNFSDEQSFGSIFVPLHSTKISSCDSRIVYALYPCVTELIQNYLNYYSVFFNRTPRLFSTINGDQLTKNYICNRFKYYNLILPTDKRINTIMSLRPFYIADILRIKGLPQSFINRQIGNNIINNQLYYHLLPSDFDGVNL